MKKYKIVNSIDLHIKHRFSYFPIISDKIFDQVYLETSNRLVDNKYWDSDVHCLRKRLIYLLINTHPDRSIY